MSSVEQGGRTRDALIVFARAPELGRVKTRLASEIGDAEALAAYRELGRICWSNALAARAAGGCRALVAYTPRDGEDAVRAWLTGADAYVAQQDGDLGERMLAALTAERDGGARRVVVIGTDCPTLSAGALADAFAALADADVVIGPATDGGYYLIGMSRAHRMLFADVPWSSAHTLAVTLGRARAAGLRVAQLHPLSDVDTADDWHAWQRAARQGV